jgi:tetraacyldisaccharide 4'-kinase
MNVNLLSWVRIFLYPLALIYGFVVWLRNRLYDSGFYSAVEFSIPVINVGNLSVGGTGKTPHVEYLVRLLQYRFGLATMSRGYKRRTQGFLLAGDKTNALQIGDEPMQYHLKFPELAVSVAEDRMTGIPQLLYQRPGVEVVLLDDAFQHRSVKAGLNILITDFARPYTEDFILPIGRLRESRSAAARADLIVVSKCPDGLSRREADGLRSRIVPKAHQQVFFTALRYGRSYDFYTGAEAPIDGRAALLVCGIARPAPLLAELERRCSLVHTLSYPDHHFFLSKDLEEIGSTFRDWQQPDQIIVTTEKDATRLHLYRDRLLAAGLPIVVLPVEVEVLFGEGAAFDARVTAFVEGMLERGPESGDTFLEG